MRRVCLAVRTSVSKALTLAFVFVFSLVSISGAKGKRNLQRETDIDRTAFVFECLACVNQGFSWPHQSHVPCHLQVAEIFQPLLLEADSDRDRRRLPSV